MSTISVVTQGDKTPAVGLTQAKASKTWVVNPRAIYDLNYGSRTPTARGFVGGHNHAELGGVHLLDLHLAAGISGAYQRASGVVRPGTPILPPAAGVTFATGDPKLLAAYPVRLVGGVTGITVDFGLIPELSSSPQSVTLGVVLRPFSLVNYNDWDAATAEGSFLYGHLKRVTVSVATADVLKPAQAVFSDVSLLGDPTLNRWGEVVFLLLSDLAANNALHLEGFVVSISTTTNLTRDAIPGDATDDRITQAEVTSGAILSPGLGTEARRQESRIARAVIGAEPGYEGGVPSAVRPWRAPLQGAHRHTGATIQKSDGTLEADGEILPWQAFSQGYAHNLGENVSEQFPDSKPAKGQKVSRGGDKVTNWLRFRQRVSLGAGYRGLTFLFALRPETFSSVARLDLYAHLHPISQTAGFGNNLLTSMLTPNGLGGVSTFVTRDGSTGFLYGTVQPTETPGFLPNAPRLLAGLGLWTLDAAGRGGAQGTSGPPVPTGVRIDNMYRVSYPVALLLSPQQVLATGDYTLEYRFALYTDSALSALDNAATLLWAGGAP